MKIARSYGSLMREAPWLDAAFVMQIILRGVGKKPNSTDDSIFSEPGSRTLFDRCHLLQKGRSLSGRGSNESPLGSGPMFRLFFIDPSILRNFAVILINPFVSGYL
jgi:hypothetical protein